MRSLHEAFEQIRGPFAPFHWHFEFPDVFFAENGELLAGDHAGFDAVLGNPPYISTHTSSEEIWRSALERRGGFLEDLYVHFAELGFQILKRGGRFGFIVSDTFFTLASKLRMRETLQRNVLTHLGQCDPFEATVDAAIFVAEKNDPHPDHEIFFVQARPRKNEQGESTKPERDLPELPSLDRIEWNCGTTFVESIGATIRHGSFRSLRLHSMPLMLPLTAHKRAFFEPRPQTVALFDRYNAKVKALVGEWWDKVEDSKKFAQNLALIREYHSTLKPGDVTLVGLIAEGGQGMRTADNARFLGYLEGTVQAKEIEAASREWSDRWIESPRAKSKFLESLKASGGEPARPTSNRAAWEAAVAKLRREFSQRELGLGRGQLYRIVPKNLVADQSDFEFTFRQRKKELLSHWRNEEELRDFGESQLNLQWQSLEFEQWREAKDISDAEFCALCNALLRWFDAENNRRRGGGKRLISREVLKLYSGESYRDPADAPRVATIHNGLSGRGAFVPFRKGDPEGSRWVDNEPLFIEWSSEHVRWLFDNSGRSEPNMPVVRNAHLYLTNGITYTLLGNHVPLKAKLQPPCIFDAGASRLTPIIASISANALLSIFNADVFSYALKKFQKHTAAFEITDLRMMPVVIPTYAREKYLSDLAGRAIETRRAIFNGQTPSNDLTAFVRGVSRSLMSGAPEYLRPDAQMLLLETAQDCLETIQLAVNWEAEKLYEVEGLGPFDEF
jgi:hypothetical protein